MQSFTKIVFAFVAMAGSIVSAAPLENRQAMTGDLTYYAPGLGACGVYNSEQDSVVALSHLLFDQSTPGGNPNNNPLCGRQIQINLNGASTVVTVADRCEGCQYGDLDVPETVFARLADPSIGRIQMTWNWV